MECRDRSGRESSMSGEQISMYSRVKSAMREDCGPEGKWSGTDSFSLSFFAVLPTYTPVTLEIPSRIHLGAAEARKSVMPFQLRSGGHPTPNLRTLKSLHPRGRIYNPKPCIQERLAIKPNIRKLPGLRNILPPLLLPLPKLPRRLSVQIALIHGNVD